MKSTSHTSRRRFLKTSVAALGFPTIVPSSVFGQNAPSNRITMAVFGWGMQGPGNTAAFLNETDCQIVAACDLDKNHLDTTGGGSHVNKRYNNTDCKTYHDFREVMARKDIDAVMLAVPDNWHALVAVEALKNGKDVYGEKPLARTIHEQQAIVQAVQKYKRIWQTGSWQRSQDSFRIAAEIVRNGLIGKIKEVHVGLPSGHTDFAGTKDKMQVSNPPTELDYEMWIGPATMEPYIEGRIHKNWRWNYNIGGGQLLDWIGHHCDIAHWGMDMDRGGPSEVRPIQVDMPPLSIMPNGRCRSGDRSSRGVGRRRCCSPAPVLVNASFDVGLHGRGPDPISRQLAVLTCIQEHGHGQWRPLRSAPHPGRHAAALGCLELRHQIPHRVHLSQ